MNKNLRYKQIYKLSQVLNIPVAQLIKLSDEQTKYINFCLNKSTFLDACAGSGKTEVISLRFSLAVKRWENSTGGMAILTFTNSAAKVLEQRITAYTNVISFPHFIGTFDSWLHNYILQPHCHSLTGYPGTDGNKSIRIIDDDKHAGFLSNYSVTIELNNSKTNLRATQYYCSEDWKSVHSNDEITNRSLVSISNDDLKKLVDNKIKFIQKGFATYTDAEVLSIKILKKFPSLSDKLSKRFPILLIDECQDLSEHQIEIIELLQSGGSNVHCVGDVKQSIYKFRKVNPENFLNYAARQKLSNLGLTNNYRSCQAIVNICNAFGTFKTPIVGVEKQKVDQAILLWEYDETSFDQLPLKFEQHLKDNELNINRSAILSRGKSTVASLKSRSKNSDLNKSELIAMAFNTWTNLPTNTENLTLALKSMGQAICYLAYEGHGNYLNQHCPLGNDAFSWRLLLRKLLEDGVKQCPFKVDGKDILWPKWVSSLKNYLELAWDKLPNPQSQFAEVKAKIRAPDNSKEIPVGTIGNLSTVQNNIRTTTIHSVKGETLDAVLLISHPNKSSKGGHHSHWLASNSNDNEHIRFAYVACSRPKHLLIIATPKLNKQEKKDFQKIGFSL